MIVDTSVLLAYLDDLERQHARCRVAIESADESLVLSPYVLAELDYLILSRYGVDAERTALTEIAGGAWELAAFDDDDLTTAITIIERYRDQEIGLADASLVVLAARYHTRTIATLDHRHFDALRPLTGGRFKVVP